MRLLGQELIGITATYVSNNVWEADVSGFGDGLVTVNATVTDDAGNSERYDKHRLPIASRFGSTPLWTK